MGSLIQALLERRSIETPREPLTGSALLAVLGGVPSTAGTVVTPVSALQFSTVFACVRVLSWALSTLPLILYRRLERGKTRAVEHPLYRILHDEPNPEMSSVDLRQALMGHLLLWGNAYCEIVRDGAGRVVEIWPLRPDRTRPVRNARNELVYETSLKDGEQIRLRADRIWHIRGFSFDGLLGYSPIALQREAIGLAMAAQEFGARFFGAGSRPSGILRTDRTLSLEAARRLKAQWEELHSGLTNAHRVAILEEGLSWQQIGIPPEDAQFLQTRQFQRTEIAAIFGIPPHKIGDLEHATFSNIEHQQLEWVIDTVRPWAVTIEQSANRSLLLPSERPVYFVEFLIDGLLRGDIESRYRAYAIGRQWGWLSANDVRELENLNPLPDGQGDQYLVPLNMVPAMATGEPEAVRAAWRMLVGQANGVAG